MAAGPENPDEQRGGRAPSLVERAAKKIVVERDQPAPASVGPIAVPTAPNGGGPLDDVQQARATEAAPLDIVGGVGGGGLDGLREPGNSEPASPDRRGARSKFVQIDVARLASRNFLTPQSKRNRTLEEFRLIKRRVLARRGATGDPLGNTVMVTSALPAEGKTTTSINLAMSIAAEEDLRVLLVDADFVKPDALRQLGVTAEKGLIDVIQDPRMDISDVMLRTDIEKLSLIPSGRLHDRCTELLASARMKELIAELSSRYEDRILIFDSPPVLATSESVALASHMGQIVFVIQAERTRRQSVESALELIGSSRNVGLVLNRVMPRIGGSDFGYYNSYYQQNAADD